jgi:hypothetical protein
MVRRTRTCSLVAAAAALFAVVALGDAYAGGKGSQPEKVFGGEILTSDKVFPGSAKSAQAYIASLKKQRKDRFWEDKENKRWKVYYAAFFKRPLNDLEVTIKLWDVSAGSKQMIQAFEQYLDRRGETAIISHILLERRYFGVNKKILMTIETHQGAVLAAGDFQILGEGEKFSGKVDFSEDDTKGAIDYDNDDDE